jgi:tetratricopeptide (TPR) repeat protein
MNASTLRLGAALLLAAAVAAGPGHALRAAEFATPPGQNVAMQEDLLRDRISRVAKDIVGEKLVDVIAHIGYVRQERTGAPAAGSDRIKLPGLNNYVTARAGAMEVSPEFIRLRQVLVIVSNDLAERAKSIERDIRTQAQMDPAKGDWLQVVPVAAALRPPGPPGAPARPQAKPEDPQAERRPDAARTELKRDTQAFQPRDDVLQEPQSTLYLINARQAYFKADYNTALDQILQSIQAKSNNPQAYAMLGSLYYAMNWKSLALKYWEKSLALDPGNRELEGLVTQLRLEKN